jgi:effector-binding domain-containing protein
LAIISKITLIEQAEQNVLSCRDTIRLADYPEAARKAYRKIKKYADSHDILFSGGPFVCYRNDDPDNLDVETGFPVARYVAGSGKIVGRTIQARKAVSALFLGAYGEGGPLMAEMTRWIAERGYARQGTIYTVYLNDEDRPRGELLTQIVIPIK